MQPIDEGAIADALVVRTIDDVAPAAARYDAEIVRWSHVGFRCAVPRWCDIITRVTVTTATKDTTLHLVLQAFNGTANVLAASTHGSGVLEWNGVLPLLWIPYQHVWVCAFDSNGNDSSVATEGHLEYASIRERRMEQNAVMRFSGDAYHIRGGILRPLPPEIVVPGL